MDDSGLGDVQDAGERVSVPGVLAWWAKVILKLERDGKLNSKPPAEKKPLIPRLNPGDSVNRRTLRLLARVSGPLAAEVIVKKNHDKRKLVMSGLRDMGLRGMVYVKPGDPVRFGITDQGHEALGRK